MKTEGKQSHSYINYDDDKQQPKEGEQKRELCECGKPSDAKYGSCCSIYCWHEMYDGIPKEEAKELIKPKDGVKEQSDIVTRQYPAKCSACNGTGSDFSRIDMMNTSSVCIVCKGKGVITVTEQYSSQHKEQSVTDDDIEMWAKSEVPFGDTDWSYKTGKREGIYIGAKAHRDGLIKNQLTSK